MTINDLYETFDAIHSTFPSISFTNTAGEQLFTINELISKEDVLDIYYKK